jgi:nifR3 family TIM-barrel protein
MGGAMSTTTAATAADAARTGPTPVLPPLRLGPHVIESPVVLAPMAGITNRAFRRLCREYGSAGLEMGGASGASSLYVAEMVTSRALVERTPETMRLVSHDPGENPRSVQLYSVDPVTAGLAARMLVSEDRADHIDLNFGCPVPKVTRKGGGAALPWKTELFRGIVRAVVREAAPYDVPVTVKMRVGIDGDHVTHLDAGRIAEAEGVAAVALHGRTAAQAYSGLADWDEIARLKESVTTIPVLGNGDIWSAEDALEMVRRTGVDGVVVGRGCLGRPWLFTDLAAAFAGSGARVRPGLREVASVLRRHAEYLVDFYDGDEQRGCRDIRKHIAWYLKGFPAGSTVRQRLALVDSLAALDDLLATLDLDQRWPGEPAEGPRGRSGSPRVVALPENWLRSRDLDAAQHAQVAQAELSVSGG